MNKKIISLVLALVMVLGTFTSVFAETAKEATVKKEEVKKTETKKAEAGEKVEKVVGKDNKIQYVIDKKLVEGYEDGTYGLDKNIKRSEITRLLVLANGNEELAKQLQGSMKIYSDVDAKHWANGVITVGTTVPSDANGIAMLAGYPDGSFKPENDVTYAELAKMLVVLAKKDLTADMVKNAIWATSWMRWAAELGILDDVTITDSNKAANRADAFTMVYNALYSMKYFKRTPANETMGIVSQFKNNEITLNQGEKAKTFKLTNTTIFSAYRGTSLDVNAKAVKGDKTLNKAVLASAISNPEYYYGTLVRVITDKDNNVTHIIELGNPIDLAVANNNNDQYKIDPNGRWIDVADATVETSTSRVLKLNAHTRVLGAVAAKVDYKNGDAKAIEFVEGTFDKTAEKEMNSFKANVNYNSTKLALTKATRYFVADVNRNQLTEVNSVDEALRILGNTSAANYFFDVYAGYNTFDGINTRKMVKNEVKGYNEATVVVFNAVQKDNNAKELLRVKNETNSKFGLTLENTDGKVIDKNVAEYRGFFPFNIGSKDAAKLDVIEYSVNAAKGIVVERKIIHKDTDVFPIVKVEKIDGREIKVVDHKGDYAYLQLTSEYDLFIKDQLKEGVLVQFHTLANNKLADAKLTNAVDIVSVMPANYDGGLKGELADVVYHNQYNQSYAKTPAIVDFTNYGTEYQRVILSNLRGLDGKAFSLDFIVMNNTEADALKAYIKATGYDKNIRFKLRNFKDADKFEAYDVEVLNAAGNWVAVRTIAPKEVTVATIKARINAANKLYNDDKVTCKNYLAAKKEVEEIKAEIANLDLEEQKTFGSNTEYDKALTKISTQVTAFETATTEMTQAVAKLETAKTTLLKDFTKKITTAEVLDAAKAKINAEIADKNCEVKTIQFSEGIAPTDNDNFARGAIVKVKFTLQHQTKTCVTAEKELAGNIENAAE